MSRRHRSSSAPDIAPGTPHGSRFRAPIAGDEISRLLPEGSPVLLQALGIIGRDGNANADANRKIKQVSHLLRLIQPALDDAFARHPEPVLVDFGAGRSALSLVVAHAWAKRQGRGRVYAVESRTELMQKASAAAAQCGLSHFEPVADSILDARLPERVHFVLALHACDVATDHAILRALRAGADHIALVPCCQAEVARLLQVVPAKAGLHELWSRPWHRREFGAHLTNVLRALTLQAHGYQVTVTELTGWEHSIKNELIIGRRVARFHRGAQNELRDLLATIPVRPWLLQELGYFDDTTETPNDDSAEPEADHDGHAPADAD
jgi:hypothetical protein